MNIRKDFDVTSDAVPNVDKGARFDENPQLSVHDKAIPMTPGERAVNDTSPELVSNKVPKMKSGGGYY